MAAALFATMLGSFSTTLSSGSEGVFHTATTLRPETDR